MSVKNRFLTLSNSAKLKAYKVSEKKINSLISELIVVLNQLSRKANTKKATNKLNRLKAKQSQRIKGNNINGKLLSANADLVALMRFKSRIKTANDEIGGLIPSASSVKSFGGLAVTGVGLLILLQAKTGAERMTASAIIAIGGYSTFKGVSSAHVTNEDKEVIDVSNDKSNINEQVVQTFVNRFNTGLAYRTCIDCMQLFEDYYKLGDDDFIEVANRHKNRKGLTLRKDIQRTVIVQPFYFGTLWNDKIIKRMNDLKIP